MTTKKIERKIDASGSATNAGIDYQQRVGAWFLVSQYTDFNINKTIDIVTLPKNRTTYCICNLLRAVKIN